MDKKTKGAIIGTGIGVLAGAIAGILLAPKSGKATRADIVNYVHEIKEKIADELEKIYNTGKVTKEAYNKVVADIVKAFESEKKILSGDAKDIQEKLDENYDEVMKTLHDKKMAEIKKTNTK